jgi:hypothetical protein
MSVDRSVPVPQLLIIDNENDKRPSPSGVPQEIASTVSQYLLVLVEKRVENLLETGTCFQNECANHDVPTLPEQAEP